MHPLPKTGTMSCPLICRLLLSTDNRAQSAPNEEDYTLDRTDLPDS